MKINLDYVVAAIAARLGKQYDDIVQSQIRYHVKHARAKIVHQYLQRKGFHSQFMQYIRVPLEQITEQEDWQHLRCADSATNKVYWRTTVTVPNGFRTGNVPFFSVRTDTNIELKHENPEFNAYLSLQRFGNIRERFTYTYENDRIYIQSDLSEELVAPNHIYIRHPFQDMDELIELIGEANCQNCDMSESLALPPDKEDELIRMVLDLYQGIVEDPKEVRINPNQQ